MESNLILLVGGAVLFIIGSILYILHRSWGDSLPTHIEIPESVSSGYKAKWATSDMRNEDNFVDQAEQDNASVDDEPVYAESAHLENLDELPVSGLLLIEHPLLRQVLQRSLAEGGLATQYVVQEGDDLYISLDLIKDPVQRRAAASMIQQFQSNTYPGAWDMLGLMGLFGRNHPH